MSQYQAVINLDFTGMNRPEYQKLISALIQAGWSYTETSALIISTDELVKIWTAAEVVAKQSAAAGTLSALTLHVQRVDGAKPYKQAANYPKALAEILAKSPPRASS